jgi:hypothetical protein
MPHIPFKTQAVYSNRAAKMRLTGADFHRLAARRLAVNTLDG